MTRRDYIELAAALNNVRLRRPEHAYDTGFNDGITITANEIAAYCASRDPKFDRARFLKNAGVQT